MSRPIDPQKQKARLIAMVDELRFRSAEIAWAEFKRDNNNPEMIGENISALANAAAYNSEAFGYLIWGLDDVTHEIVGTEINPDTQRVSSQPLEIWLAAGLSPSIHFQFDELDHPDGRIVILSLAAATVAPVKFKGQAYIRVGESKVSLSRFPEREATLWERLRPSAWEANLAAEHITEPELLSLLDWESYFDLLQLPKPTVPSQIIEILSADGLVVTDFGKRWSIRNVGAILLANTLNDFPHLSRKAVRVIEHAGSDRVDSRRERLGAKGYAAGFRGLRDYLKARLPENEYVQEALRQEVSVYPDVAVREIVANALIHQDLTIKGAGPVVEIFEDRLEVTNPGKPLIAPERMIDLPPRSRNEKLASTMRRMRICDERGAGVDRIVSSAELYQMPPPDFQVLGDNMRATLYAPRSFASMSAQERVRACYQHAVIRYIGGEAMTNSTLRQRLGVADQNAAQVSRIIKDATAASLIKPADPKAPRAGYVPFWVGVRS